MEGVSVTRNSLTSSHSSYCVPPVCIGARGQISDDAEAHFVHISSRISIGLRGNQARPGYSLSLGERVWHLHTTR